MFSLPFYEVIYGYWFLMTDWFRLPGVLWLVCQIQVQWWLMGCWCRWDRPSTHSKCSSVRKPRESKKMITAQCLFYQLTPPHVSLLAAGRPIRAQNGHTWVEGRGFRRRTWPIRGVRTVKSCWWEEEQSSALRSWELKGSTNGNNSSWTVRSLTSWCLLWRHDAFSDLMTPSLTPWRLHWPHDAFTDPMTPSLTPWMKKLFLFLVEKLRKLTELKEQLSLELEEKRRLLLLRTSQEVHGVY